MVKTTSPRTAIVCCLSLSGVVLCEAPSAQARVTQVVIKATESPTFGGKSFGAVGQYERISGQIVGEVDPTDPVNAVMVDIELETLNDSKTGNDTATSGDADNGFLMRQGYIVLESGWDFSAPRNGKLFTAV